MARIRVAVVYGGRSSEHGISVVSAGSVISALDPERYEVIPVGISTDGRWMLTDGKVETMQITDRVVPQVTSGSDVVLAPDPTVAGLGNVDVVFPVLHGRFGEDGTIQGLFEMAGVPYVGPGVFASAAAMDKEFTKKLLAAEGLDGGRYVVLRRPAELATAKVEDLGLPVFVKPARAGSSLGISKVNDWAELPAAVDEAFRHDNKVLIEAAVVGREIECGVLENADGLPEASLPAEIRLVRGHDWYDFEAKYLDDACEFDIPALLPAHVIEAVREAACRAFTALDCAGLARVDFFVTPDERVLVNEVNTMPGFTPISMYPQMWAATGVDYPTLVDRLIAAALRRGAA